MLLLNNKVVSFVVFSASFIQSPCFTGLIRTLYSAFYDAANIGMATTLTLIRLTRGVCDWQTSSNNWQMKQQQQQQNVNNQK